jgi:hypothetical protein
MLEDSRMQRLPGGDEGTSQRATTDDVRPRTKVAALTAAQRRRLPHIGPTVEREIDVERAFAEEQVPASDATAPDVSAPRSSGRRDPELEPLGTEIVMRIDGSKNAMSIVTGLSAPPSEGVQELAALICRGIVRLRR